MEFTQQQIYSVSELNNSIKRLLESQYRFVRIRGELSNVKTPYSGHSYFSLKDASSQIRAVLFKQKKRFVAVEFKEGQEVVCFGRISLYEPRGEYQVIVDSIELYGKGQLQLEFERLKEKLASQGYFAESQKQPIPYLPKNIAVISSPTGAAFQDFLKIVGQRKSTATIQLFPVPVQGDTAATEISNAMHKLNSLHRHEVIVLCRGGGSIEDLWAFNEEIVADAIHASKIPVISAIGHEIDFTISDFCADLRCPTPTAAAETLSPDNIALLNRVRDLQNRIANLLSEKIYRYEQQLRYHKKVVESVSVVFSDYEHRLNLSKNYHYNAMREILVRKEAEFSQIKGRIQLQTPKSKLERNEQLLIHQEKALHQAFEKLLDKKETKFKMLISLLNSVSPLATLSRGYAVARSYDSKGNPFKVIRDSAKVKEGESVNILLSKGELDCVVTEKKD